MDPELITDSTTTAEYQDLMKRCGKRPRADEAVKRALDGSLFMVGAYDGDKLIAFARVCGDDALYYTVCDVICDSEYARTHSIDPGMDPEYTERIIKGFVLKEIDDYLNAVVTKDSRVMVFVERPDDELFRKLGYKYLDEDYRTVMIKSRNL
jgi:hypothetical protein